MLLNADGKPLFSTGCDSYTELDRQKNYSEFRLMYRNKKWNLNQRDYEGKLFGNSIRRAIYIMINFPGLLSRACGDLLFGEPVRFKASKDSAQGANEYLNKVLRDSLFDSQLFTSGVSNSYRGDAVFTIEVRNGVGYIKTIPAYNYYIKADPDDPKRALKEYVAWKTEAVNGSDVVRIQEHGDGYILESAYLADKSQANGVTNWKIGAQVSLEFVYGMNEGPREEVNFDPALGRMIQHIPNFDDDEQYFGISDYPDLVPIFEGINNRVSNLDSYLDTHSRPKLIGGAGMSDMFGNFDFASDYLEPMDQEVGKNIRYLTWDGKSDVSLLELQYLEDKFFQISELSPAIFGIKVTGGIDSAMAMRQFFTRTKAKINRKRMLYHDRLKRFLISVSRFFASQNLPEAVECTSVELLWQDGIPRDYFEAVDVEARRVNAGLSSVDSALRRLEMTEEGGESEVEIQKILDERAKGILPPVGSAVDKMAGGGGSNNIPA
jgi:hypothetical protein